MKNIMFYSKYKGNVRDAIDVDLTQCKNDKDIFNSFKVAFDFPDWFGDNWDAFHDCITNLSFNVKDSLFIRLYGLQNIFSILQKQANFIINDLICMAKGDVSQDDGKDVNVIIFLYDINEDCEKCFFNKDLMGLEVVSDDQDNICPVCGYRGFDEPPYIGLDASCDICPCCGVEFGFDDFDFESMSFVIARNKWLKDGAKWFNKNQKPKNWNLEEQLKNTELPQIKALEKALQLRCKKS